MESLLWYAVDCICGGSEGMHVRIPREEPSTKVHVPANGQAMLLARVVVMQVETTTAFSTSVLQIYSRLITGTAGAMHGHRCYWEVSPLSAASTGMTCLRALYTRAYTVSVCCKPCICVCCPSPQYGHDVLQLAHQLQLR